MSTELKVGSRSSELKTNELELGLTFGTFTGKMKANFDKAKEYFTESVSAIGAYVTEVFNVNTNQSFTAKNKNEKK